MRASAFTGLAGQIAVLHERRRADLHLHTTSSDGTHTPTSLVERALQAGLTAIAVTDHDSTAAWEPTRASAAEQLLVLTGVEITCTWNNTEVHLLGYDFDPTNEPLQAALARLRAGRWERVQRLAERLTTMGVSIQDDVARWSPMVALGRRHLAKLLIERGHVRTLYEAFARYLGPLGASVPKERLPVAEAIRLLHEAGGIASWAHPPLQTTHDDLAAWQTFGLDAVEAVYPWSSPAHGKRLRSIALTLGLCITGGSDSHDPGPSQRGVGAKTILWPEVAKLRAAAQRWRAA